MTVSLSPGALGPLPPRPAPLVGREEALRTASGLLGDRRNRLLTLRGPGGIGKTRLALELAYQLGPHYELGAAWVNLAELRGPSEVVPAIAQALGVPGQASGELVTHLAPHSLLLVLDNFEHVAAAAPEVAALRARIPGLRLLVTSRTALRVRGEHELPLGLLPLPGPAQPGLASPAVRLFVDCAQSVDPHFQVTPTNERAVTRICQRLEGLPLALELAAARLRTVTPEGLLGWLDRPLEVLVDGPRDGPHHGHSLRSTIGWSVDLLAADQRAVFAACGSFMGGFTLAALEAVTGKAQARPALIGLVEHSLLYPTQGGPEPRWRLLEPVREFAAQMLGGLPEADVLRDRHARHYLALAEQVHPEAQGADLAWWARLRSDDANLAAALGWLVQTQQTLLALRLVRALGGYWDHAATHRHHDWLCRVVALPGAADEPALLADALCALGLTSRNLQRLEQARQALHDAGELYRQLGDAAGQADVLLILASVHSGVGEHERALELFRRVQAIYEETNHTLGLSDVAHNLGVTDLRAGQHAAASGGFEQTEVLSRERNSEQGLAFARGLLSWSAYLQGKRDIALPLAPLAWQHILRVPNALLRSTLLYQLAFHARDAGQLRLAARMVGCSEAMRAGTGEPWDSSFLPHAQRLDAVLRADSGPRYLEWRAEGSALGLEELAPEVETLLGQLVHTAPPPERLSPLTPREREVLALLAQGIPDKKIAQRLHIGAATASKHVSSMLGKLEIHNRVQLARWALEHGLGEASAPGTGRTAEP